MESSACKTQDSKRTEKPNHLVPAVCASLLWWWYAVKWCVVQRLDGEGLQLLTERGSWPAGARVSLASETLNRCARNVDVIL